MLRYAPVVLLIVASPAYAEVPPLAFGLEYGGGHGGKAEAFDFTWRGEAGLFARVGHWQLTGSITSSDARSANAPRDGATELTTLGIDTLLSYRLPLGDHGVLSIGGGIDRLWMYTDSKVTRTCRETGCLAGFWIESPSYHAWVPELRIGIGPSVRTEENFVAGLTFDLIVDAIDFADVPPAGARGVSVIGSLTLQLGGGPGSKDPTAR